MISRWLLLLLLVRALVQFCLALTLNMDEMRYNLKITSSFCLYLVERAYFFIINYSIIFFLTKFKLHCFKNINVYLYPTQPTRQQFFFKTILLATLYTHFLRTVCKVSLSHSPRPSRRNEATKKRIGDKRPRLLIFFSASRFYLSLRGTHTYIVYVYIVSSPWGSERCALLLFFSPVTPRRCGHANLDLK